MKCNYKGWCCDKAEGNECVAAEDFACEDKISEREYQLINDPKEKEAADYAEMEHARQQRQI